MIKTSQKIKYYIKMLWTLLLLMGCQEIFAESFYSAINNGNGGDFSLKADIIYEDGALIGGDTTVDGNNALVDFQGGNINVCSNVKLVLKNCRFKKGNAAIYGNSNCSITLENCTVEESEAGIYAEDSTLIIKSSKITKNLNNGLGANNCNIQINDSEFSYNGDNGIVSNSNGDCAISSSIFSRNHYDGIVVQYLSKLYVFDSYVVDNDGEGIYIQDSTGTIEGSWIVNNGNVILDGNGIFGDNSSIIVSNCYIANNYLSGISLKTQKSEVRNCTIISNRKSGGIYLDNTSDSTLDHNIILNNNAGIEPNTPEVNAFLSPRATLFGCLMGDNPRSGSEISSGAVMVFDFCGFIDNDHGANLFNGASGNFCHCDIRNTTMGVYGLQSNITLTGCSIEGHSEYGVMSGSGPWANAVGNWWGAPSGPSGGGGSGDRIFNTDASNFLVSRPLHSLRYWIPNLDPQGNHTIMPTSDLPAGLSVKAGPSGAISSPIWLLHSSTSPYPTLTPPFGSYYLNSWIILNIGHPLQYETTSLKVFMKYNHLALPPGINPQNLVIYGYEKNLSSWVYPDQIELDTINGMVKADFSPGSRTYALLWSELEPKPTPNVGAPVTGRIVDSRTQKGISGARVQVDDGAVVVYTIPDGTFYLYGLEARQYTLQTWGYGYSFNEQTIYVPESITPFSVGDIPLDLIPRVLIGKIVDSFTDEPLMAACVQVDGGAHFTLTDENGGFIIPFLSTGSHKLQVWSYAYNFKEVSFNILENIYTDAGTIKTETIPNTVIGQIVDANSGSPVLNAHVQYDYGGSNQETTTNISGRFILVYVPPGNHTLQVWGYAYSYCTEEFYSQNGGRMDLGTVSISPLGNTVSGQLVDAISKRNIYNARVQLDGGGSWFTESALNGHFIMYNVSSGSHTFQTWGYAYRFYEDDISVQQESSTYLGTVYLTPDPNTFNGRILNSKTRLPLPYAQVFMDNGGNVSVFPAGRFCVLSVPKGIHTLKFSAPGFRDLIFNTIHPGEDKNIELGDILLDPL